MKSILIYVSVIFIAIILGFFVFDNQRTEVENCPNCTCCASPFIIGILEPKNYIPLIVLAGLFVLMIGVVGAVYSYFERKRKVKNVVH